MDIREELAHLRATVSGIDRKYADLPRRARDVPRPHDASFVEELLSGEVVETPFGKHFETEKFYGLHKRYGSYDISNLLDLPCDLLAAISGGLVENRPPASWAFLDTETTGPAGRPGTCAFLTGVGSIDAQGFRVRQFFMREYGEEASLLFAVSAYLSRFDVLITYNGKTFDQPLLETRYAALRVPHPFAQMRHFDLLHGARRLFKIRLENCRLVNLENEVLGFERENDVPGELIPYCYFEYLRTRTAFRLIPVFHHNVLDIVSLACLTGVIPAAFSDPEHAVVRHGSDLLGLANWLRLSGRLEESHCLMRRAIHMGLPDQQLFQTLYETGALEKKLKRSDHAYATFADLSLSPNPFQARAFDELAKYHEHRERDLAKALECVRAAQSLEASAARAVRRQRLEAKCARLTRRPAPKKKSAEEHGIRRSGQASARGAQLRVE